MDFQKDRSPSGDKAYDYIKMSFELKGMKLYKEAIEMLYKALSCEDISEKTTEVVSQIGDLYFLLKNYDRAIDQYEKALESNNSHTHSLNRLCQIYFLKDDFEKALELTKELCERVPDLENYIGYFKILLELKRFDEMKELYETLSPKIQKSDKILYILSFSDFENREEYLKKVIGLNPDFPEAQLDLGIIYFQKEKFKDAQACLEKVVQKDSKCAPAHYHLGLIEQIKQNPSKAIEYFLSASKLQPDNERYLFDLAKAYTDIAWYDEAQISAADALRILRVKNPQANFNEYYFLLSWIYIQKKDFKSALLSLDLISENSAIDNEADILKNIVKLEEGNVAEAKAGLEASYNANDTNKENPLLLSALGKAYKELKMYDNAVATYENALRIFPNSFEYASELIDLLIDNKEYKKAMEYAQDFKELNPSSAGVYNSMARIYYREKKLEEALGCLKELVKLDANIAEAHYFMGLILNNLGRIPEAKPSLKKALELDPFIPKYYAQMAGSYMLEGDYDGAALFIKEAIGMLPQEIAYLKTALEITQKTGDKEGEKFYTSQLKRLEDVLKSRQ